MKVGRYNYEIIGDYLMCNENLFIRIDKIDKMDINQDSAYLGNTYKFQYALRLWNSEGKLIYSTDKAANTLELIDLAKMIANHSNKIEL